MNNYYTDHHSLAQMCFSYSDADIDDIFERAVERYGEHLSPDFVYHTAINTASPQFSLDDMIETVAPMNPSMGETSLVSKPSHSEAGSVKRQLSECLANFPAGHFNHTHDVALS